MSWYNRILVLALCLGIQSCLEPQRSTETTSKGPTNGVAKKSPAAGGSQTPHSSPLKKRPPTIPTLTPEATNSPIPVGVIQPQDVAAIVKEAGKILKRLSNDQAKKALATVEPEAPSTASPREEIAKLLINAKTAGEAQAILEKLKAAQNE
jgi:hypothetical protein